MFHFEFEVGCELTRADVGTFLEHVSLLLSDITIYSLFISSAMGFISGIGRTKFSALFLSNVSRGFSLFCLLVIVSCQHTKCTYLNQIAVHIEGGSHIADRIATKHGYTNMGQVCIPIIVICHTYYCLLGWTNSPNVKYNCLFGILYSNSQMEYKFGKIIILLKL